MVVVLGCGEWCDDTCERSTEVVCVRECCVGGRGVYEFAILIEVVLVVITYLE